jgi:hypothetical protein
MLDGGAELKMVGLAELDPPYFLKKVGLAELDPPYFLKMVGLAELDPPYFLLPRPTSRDGRHRPSTRDSSCRLPFDSLVDGS